MIDIKSLRIGSHVEYNGKRVCVDEICTLRSKDAPIHLIVSRNRLVCGYPSIDEIEPIPITPELLTELGFKSKREGCWQHWWKDGFDLQHRDESEYWHFHGDIGLEYLHELESLYYMIYGVELIKE